MKKEVSIFILLIAVAFLGKGQESAEHNQIDSLLDKSFRYTQINLDTSVELALKAKRLSIEKAYYFGYVNSYSRLSIAYRFKGLYDLAIEKADSCLSLSNGKYPKIEASAYNNKGVCYRKKGQADEALKNYLKSIEIYKADGDTLEIATIYNSIGVMFMYSDFPEKALQYYETAESLHSQISNSKGLADVYNNFAIFFANSGRLDKSLEYFNKSLEIEKSLNNKRGVIESYGNIGLVYFMQGQVDKAIEMTKKSIAIEKEMGNIQGEIASMNSIAEMYSEVGRFQEALETLDSVIIVAKKIDSHEELATSYLNMSKLYEKQGNFEKAYENFVLFHQEEDSAKSYAQQKVLAEMETRFQTKEKEQQLALQELEIVKNKTALEARKRLILLLLVLSLAIIFLSLFLLQRNERKAQAEKDAAIIEERDKGIQAVFNAQEEERKRISKDLHDGVGQQLSGLKMAFQKLAQSVQVENPEQGKQLEQLNEILNESADEVRSISHQMMPKALTELGLKEAIQDMLEKSLGNLNIDYEFEHFGISERLEEKIEVSLYRICQELINNIIKHSKANKVTVQLFKNKDKLILIVEDNGIGIKQDKVNTGHGLLNIKSRLNPLSGEVNFEPSPQSGTIATIRIPYV